jgi:phosphatidylinositol-3-phosphatase
MVRRLAVLLSTCCALLAAGSVQGATADLLEPVSVTADAPQVVSAGESFKLGVEVAAEAGALDIAKPPLHLRVRYAPECGGSFAGSEGPIALDRTLPAPVGGAAYSQSVSVKSKIGSTGTMTVCAFLEDSEERQFATDTEAEIAVVPPCAAAQSALAKLRRQLRGLKRRIATTRRHLRGAHGARRHRLVRRLQKLRRKRSRLARRLRKARLIARQACNGAGRRRPHPFANGGSGASTGSLPQIKHLFVIVLENENAENTFGASPPSPYLGATLREAGAFIPNYYGIGHESLDNYIAMVSGQPPNLETQADCQAFTEMVPGLVRTDGVALGQGCVFPRSVRTIANQLENSGQTWRGYMQDMANGVPEGEPATCRHPALGGVDSTQKASAADQYAARHNPFVYFHAIIDYPTCDENDVDLSRLPEDLSGAAATPAYSFITPDLCSDGHDETCANPALPGGFAGIDAFLREWVPRIQASPAYRDQGAILVTFDESASGAGSCCNEPTGPNTPNNGGPEPGNGGGRVGAVMVSPCIKPGTVTQAAYNHYSFLRWAEDNFGLAHLGYAAREGLEPFGPDVFTKPACDPELARIREKAGAQVRLIVKPKRVRADRPRVFHLRLTSETKGCLANAPVRIANRRARTNSRGRLSLRLTFRRPGKRLVYAKPPGCPRAKTSIRVIARRSLPRLNAR